MTRFALTTTLSLLSLFALCGASEACINTPRSSAQEKEFRRRYDGDGEGERIEAKVTTEELGGYALASVGLVLFGSCFAAARRKDNTVAE